MAKIKNRGHMGIVSFLGTSQMEKCSHDGLPKRQKNITYNTWAPWILVKTHSGVQSSPCIMTLSASFILIIRLVSTIYTYLTENFKMDVLKVEKKRPPKLLRSKILYRNQDNVDNAFSSKSMSRRFKKWWWFCDNSINVQTNQPTNQWCDYYLRRHRQGGARGMWSIEGT